MISMARRIGWIEEEEIARSSAKAYRDISEGGGGGIAEAPLRPERG
jgi:hypothetical protein